MKKIFKTAKGRMMVVLIVSLSILSLPAHAGLVTDDLGLISPPPQATLDNLVTTLLGGGVVISNVTYTGHSTAAGAFIGGTGILPFDEDCPFRIRRRFPALFLNIRRS